MRGRIRTIRSLRSLTRESDLPVFEKNPQILVSKLDDNVWCHQVDVVYRNVVSEFTLPRVLRV